MLEDKITASELLAALMEHLMNTHLDEEEPKHPCVNPADQAIVDEDRKYGYYRFHDLARSGEVDKLEFLFDEGYDTSFAPAADLLPLQLAFKHNHKFIAFQLYYHGAILTREHDPNGLLAELKIYSLISAITPAQELMTQTFVESHGYHNLSLIEEPGENKRVSAEQRGYSDFVKLVLRGDEIAVKTYAEAHPTAVKEQGLLNLTPLHWAALNDDHEMVHVLLSLGADPNVVADHGISPLHCAAMSLSAMTFNVLTRNRARINTICPLANKWSPLHVAAYFHGESMCLLEIAAEYQRLSIDLNLKCSSGRTYQQIIGNYNLRKTHAQNARDEHKKYRMRNS